MKKLLLLLFSLIAFSCNDQLTFNSVDFSEVVNTLNKTYTAAFDVAISSKPENVYSNTYELIDRELANVKLDPNKIRQQPQAEIVGAFHTTQITSANLNLSFLNQNQKTILIPMLDKILSLSDIALADEIIIKFNDQVIISSFTTEEKFQLLSISSGVKASINIISEAVSKYGVKLIGTPIVSDEGGDSNNSGGSPASDTGGINVPGALQAGVLGLVTGAISGGYAGGTGGTVVFPIVGTITGAVGGAVVGGAIGFIGGVSMSIVQDILFSKPKYSK